MSFARYQLFGLLLLAGPLAWGVSGDPPGGVRCSRLVVRNDRFQALALTEMLGMERYVRDNHFARFVEELGLSQRISEAVRAAVDVVDPLALNRETVARMATSLGLVTEAEKGGLYATLARRLGVDTRHTLAILRKMETELLGSDTGARARANESLLVEREKVAAQVFSLNRPGF